MLDLGFVRDLVALYYAASGRPCTDPVVFFEGLRSDRRLTTPGPTAFPEAAQRDAWACSHKGTPDWTALDHLHGFGRDSHSAMHGVCIDSAHLWGAGYDLTTREGVEHVLEEIDRAVGLAQVRVLHANDSPAPLGSRRDQHTHHGQGQIGYAELAALLAHPALDGIPAVLETPDGGVEEEIIRVRVAALLCMGDAEGACAPREAALPVHDVGSAAAEAS